MVELNCDCGIMGHAGMPRILKLQAQPAAGEECVVRRGIRIICDYEVSRESRKAAWQGAILQASCPAHRFRVIWRSL